MNKIEVFDAKGQSQESIDLKFDFPKKDVSSKTYASAIRVLFQNWRQGTAACKGRGDIAFSGRKPWKQKGTGRARAGTASSPLWRKGGVIFGPQIRSRKLKLSCRQRAAVFNSVFSLMFEQEKIKCLSFGEKQTKPETKKAFDVLKKAGLHDKKIILFLDFNDSVNFASFRNIRNVEVIFFDQPNAFNLTCGRYWAFLKKDKELFKDMVSKWN